MTQRTLKSKDVWMTAADIPQTTIFMVSEPCRFFLQSWPKLGLGNKVTKYFSYFNKDFCRMQYVRSEFNAGADFLANKMLMDPRWALNLIDRVENWSRIFFQKSDVILNSPLPRMTNKQLIKLYQQCLKYQRLSHGIGPSISWLADAEKERVTKAIWSALAKHIKKTDQVEQLADIFSILTTPSEQSLVAKEERDFLTIAGNLSAKSAVRRVFLTNKPDQLLAKLKQIDRLSLGRLIRYHARYSWLTYQYRGPATPLEDYLGRWQQLLISKVDPHSLLRKILTDRRKVLLRQRQLIKKYQFTPYLKSLIMLAQRMVFIKEFRKDALYHGMYCYEPLFREIGRRLGLTLNQIWAMNSWEISPALLNHKFDVNELNARQQLAVAYVDRKNYIVYTGQSAKKFLSRITFEKLKLTDVKDLSGTPACPGKVSGKVKIVNVPEQMVKMRVGDILVAHNTNPNLVPAMKKAAAIITEAGGLTCHAAIVARELRIPCVVGVLGADKLLKDGDRVEVDATKGIVRKI